MCLSIPAKVIEIEGNMAKVSIGGTEYRASLELVENVGIGDYVLVHTGFAIQKLAEDEAIETLRLFEEFQDLNKKLDEEEKEFRNPSNPGT